MNAARLNALKTTKWQWKEYKENVRYTEDFHGWNIEIEYDVPIQPAWFDPDYDDYLDLEDMELEKGHNFYITKNKETFQSLWTFTTLHAALDAAKDAIKIKNESARQKGYRYTIPSNENPWEI